MILNNMHKLVVALGLASLSFSRSAHAQEFPILAEIPEIGVVRRLAGGLDHPWGLAFLPDEQILVTERNGGLRLIDGSGTISPPIAGVPEVYASGQGGLLDVALDPDFTENRLVYISYAEPGGDGMAGTAVARGRLNASGTRLQGTEVIFRQTPKVRSEVHFGGRLVFAPDDTLFISLGERGQMEEAQNISNTLGTLVRIHKDGSIPADNPFIGRSEVRPEIWSYGHRNIQGAALHPKTGAIWVHEHGPRGGDEINIARAGENYGWPVITYGRAYSGGEIGIGTAAPSMAQPIHYWVPSIAPSGMVFYDGDVFPNWKGSLLVGALAGQMLVRLELGDEEVLEESRLLEELGERLRDVRQGPDGRIYLLTDSAEGALLRIEPHFE